MYDWKGERMGWKNGSMNVWVHGCHNREERQEWRLLGKHHVILMYSCIDVCCNVKFQKEK